MARHARHRRKAPPVRKAELRIDHIGARGDGVGRADGVSVYVPFTAPGDTARVSLRGDRGALEALIEESPHRAAPACRHFGACGGCALQHLDTDYYAGWKRGLVTAALAREGFDEGVVAPLIACPPASRRRAAFAAVRNGGGVVLGFNRRRAAEVIDIAECPVLAPVLAEKLTALRALAGATPLRRFDLAVTLCENGLDIDIQREDADYFGAADIERLADAMRAAGCVRLTLNGEPVLEFEKPVVMFAAAPVTPPPGGFLQASREGEAALVACVTPHLEGARRIADLFCGCGTFSLPLAQAARVDAYDADRPAIAALDAAARMGGLKHPVEARARNLFNTPLTGEELAAYDVVVFDPPRAGAKLQAEMLASSPVPMVIGVSCNPATFARDAAILRGGGYQLSQVTPVDQFVYAPHVELVGVFQKG